MEHPAPTDHPVHEMISRRYSPRAFADRGVKPEALAALFEAARWAPSCFNDQPWSFVVATRDEPESHAQLLSLLSEGNQRWAGAAPVLALSVARTTFRQNGKPNRHAWHDVGLAAATLTFEATARGLAVHQMAGFDAGRARRLLSIPADHEPVAAIAIGYPGEPEQLPAELAERERAPRARRPIDAFVFTGRYGVARY